MNKANEDPKPAVTDERELPAIDQYDGLPEIRIEGEPWSWQLATWPASSKKILRQPATTSHLSAVLAALSDDARAEVIGAAINNMTPALAIELLTKDERIAGMFETVRDSESRAIIAEADRDKAWSLNRDLNDQLFTALKETGEAQADEAKAAMSLKAAEERAASAEARVAELESELGAARGFIDAWRADDTAIGGTIATFDALDKFHRADSRPTCIR